MTTKEKVKNAVRVLEVCGKELYVQQREYILCLDMERNLSVKTRVKLPGFLSWGLPQPVARLFRLSVHNLVVIQQEALVFSIRGSIVRYDIRKGEFISTPVLRGTRPLFLCCASDNKIFYGDYFGNDNREIVQIYGSEDGGKSYQSVHVFPASTVRHIHGVFHDPYTESLWVTTGDNDEESGIWKTDDEFRTLTRIIGGSQCSRAVQLLFTQNHVYFGSDAPATVNNIFRLHKDTGDVERLQEVESSVFWGCKVGDKLFFSTAVEPSKVNKYGKACIWGSVDGCRWKSVARFSKDLWPMKLFQYGQIFFPNGKNDTDYLFFTPFATEKHGSIQCLKVADIFGE